MSEQNVEIARQIYRGFNARKLEDVAALAHPDAAWYQAGPFPDARSYHGIDDIRDNLWQKQFLDTFEDFRFNVDQLIDSGDHVAIIGTVQGHGASGLAVEAAFVHILRFENDLCVWGMDCAGISRSF